MIIDVMKCFVMRARSFGTAKAAQLVLGATLAAGGLVAMVGPSPSSVSAPAAAYAAPALSYTTAAVAAVSGQGATPAESQSSQHDTRSNLPNLDNPRVDSWIARFTSDLKGSFATYMKRMDRYATMISTKLEQRDMPQDLVYLAMIESGFNPTAKSPAQASGLWQFIADTGRRYGLTVNRKVDERNDPAKATDAALSYLGDLYDRFGSWYLAAAAYNTGEGRVARVMRAVTGSERGTDADYYRIASRLPKETRDYVPKLIAAARIANDPATYGFTGSTAAVGNS